MSIGVMSLVWEESQLRGSELLLLLAISDFANNEGVAYPSVLTLAKKIRMSERNTQYLIRKIEESRELVVKRNAGPHGCNLFVVKTLRGAKLARVQAVAQAGAMGSVKEVQPIAPEPSMNRQEPSIYPDCLKRKKAKQSDKETLFEFLNRCEGEGIMPIPEDDPIFAYADTVGIGDWIPLSWFVFKGEYNKADKKQKDWRAHYRNVVKKNWLKLWYLKPDNTVVLTTAGRQAMLEMNASQGGVV